ESTALQNAALRRTLASAKGVGLYANSEWDLTGTTPSRLLSPQQMQMVSNVLVSFLSLPLRRAPGPPPWAGLTTPLYGVTNAARRAFLSEPPQLELGYRNALADNGRLVAGSYPGNATLTGPRNHRTVTLQVAVPTATAARFELRPGSRLDLAPSGNGPAPAVVLRVAGIIRPARPGSAFWASAGVIAQPSMQGLSWLGGALLGGAELSVLPIAFPLQAMQVQWGIPVDI